MYTFQLRHLLGGVAFAALLPLVISGCEDPASGTADGGTDSDDDVTSDTVTATPTATATDANTATATATETGETESMTGVTETGDTETGGTETTGATETGDTGTGGIETTGVTECEQVTIESPSIPFDQGPIVYRAALSNTAGAAAERLIVEFYTDDGDFQAAGDVDLASGDNANYSTCVSCVLIVEDRTRTYFQSEGTLGLTESPDTLTSELTFTGVRLVEITIGNEFVSTPVPDGGCIDIVDSVLAPLPTGWNCDPAAYEDGATCDCGCGIVDSDCANALVASCDECNSVDSCIEGGDSCDAITGDDNSSCTASYMQLFEDIAVPAELTLDTTELTENWFLTSDEFQGGVQSFQAGNDVGLPGELLDDQTAGFSVEFEFPVAGLIAFWIRTSIEPDYDFLEFYIDGVEQETWTGLNDWTQQSYPVAAGTHTFRWAYAKDSSDPAGRGWADSVGVDTIEVIEGNLVP